MSKAVWHRDANRWDGSPSAVRLTFTGFVTLIHPSLLVPYRHALSLLIGIFQCSPTAAPLAIPANIRLFGGNSGGKELNRAMIEPAIDQQ